MQMRIVLIICFQGVLVRPLSAFLAIFLAVAMALLLTPEARRHGFGAWKDGGDILALITACGNTFRVRYEYDSYSNRTITALYSTVPHIYEYSYLLGWYRTVLLLYTLV